MCHPQVIQIRCCIHVTHGTILKQRYQKSMTLELVDLARALAGQSQQKKLIFAECELLLCVQFLFSSSFSYNIS